MPSYTKLETRSPRTSASEELDDMMTSGGEISPAYKVLRNNQLLTTKYRVKDVKSLVMRPSNSSPEQNALTSICLLPCCGCPCFYHNAEVAEGNISCIEDGRGSFEFLGPGVHQIKSWFVRIKRGSYNLATPNLAIEHGDRAIVTVEQGYIGFAMDMGQPVLLPPELSRDSTR